MLNNIKVRMMVVTIMVLCIANGYLFALVLLDFTDVIKIKAQMKIAYLVSLIVIPMFYKMFKNMKIKVKMF